MHFPHIAFGRQVAIGRRAKDDFAAVVLREMPESVFGLPWNQCSAWSGIRTLTAATPYPVIVPPESLDGQVRLPRPPCLAHVRPDAVVEPGGGHAELRRRPGDHLARLLVTGGAHAGLLHEAHKVHVDGRRALFAAKDLEVADGLRADAAHGRQL